MTRRRDTTPWRHLHKAEQDRLIARALRDAMHDIIEAHGAFEVLLGDTPDVVWSIDAITPLAVA